METNIEQLWEQAILKLSQPLTPEDARYWREVLDEVYISLRRSDYYKDLFPDIKRNFSNCKNYKI